MTQFKVGDRVAVYGWLRYRGQAPFYLRGDKGTVVSITAADEIEISLSEYPNGIEAHPKQCRLLVKKERRRVWIHNNNIPFIGDYSHEKGTISVVSRNEECFIEFIEVVRKK